MCDWWYNFDCEEALKFYPLIGEENEGIPEELTTLISFE